MQFTNRAVDSRVICHVLAVAVMFVSRLAHKHTQKSAFFWGEKKAQLPIRAIVGDINLMCQLDRLSVLLKKKMACIEYIFKPMMSHDINRTNKPAYSRLVAGLMVAHM